MSKVRKDYDKTWQGRLAKWMREGSGGLEKNMTEALGEDASLHSREISAETLQQRVHEIEHKIYPQAVRMICERVNHLQPPE